MRDVSIREALPVFHGFPRAVLAVLLWTSAARATTDAPAAFEQDLRPFLQAHCFTCHGSERQKGDLNLEAAAAGGDPLADAEFWDRVTGRIAAGDMPPEDQPRPVPEHAQQFAATLTRLLAERAAQTVPAPGRVTMRRLNRAEYDNTVRDLLGVHAHASAEFPPDDSGYGFDTIGDVLSLSPLLMEKYLDAAETISRHVVLGETSPYALLSPQRQVFVCGHAPHLHTLDCARTNLGALARRAYRRPIVPEEVDRLLEFVRGSAADGGSIVEGVEIALQAVLVSPQFLFRAEAQPAPGETARKLSDLELASRLSYFLWSSMPDEELLAAAEQHALGQPEILTAQVLRMLRDPKARGLVENFGGQWLEVRNLQRAHPTPELFPEFDEALRAAMAEETMLFFQSIVQEDRSILEFLDADYTFANEQLAKYYGMEGVSGAAFQRVAVDRERRGGVLTQASVLTVTSYPNRTSPVLRGVWILKNILDAPPPPPPPNVPALDQAEVDKTATLRMRLEAHRKDPTCASCHSRMDPLGFGLENYNAVGAWRSTEQEAAIDATGVLPDGQEFAGPRELKAILLERRDEFARCLTEKMLTYALGRGVESFDRQTIDDIAARAAAEDYRFSALVLGIVNSLAFQHCQADVEAA